MQLLVKQAFSAQCCLCIIFDAYTFLFTCTMFRLLEAIQTVTDALPIPENESHAVITLSSFAVAVQEIQADSVQQQSFRYD